MSPNRRHPCKDQGKICTMISYGFSFRYEPYYGPTRLCSPNGTMKERPNKGIFSSFLELITRQASKFRHDSDCFRFQIGILPWWVTNSADTYSEKGDRLLPEAKSVPSTHSNFSQILRRRPAEGSLRIGTERLFQHASLGNSFRIAQGQKAAKKSSSDNFS
jgi:hypothetical protein